MKQIFEFSLMILLMTVGTLAQQPVQPRYSTRIQSGIRSDSPPSTKNYRLELSIQRGEQTARYKVMLNGGSLNTELMDRFADWQEGMAPQTIGFTATLTPFDAEGAEVNVNLNRQVTFKTKVQVQGAAVGTEKEVLSSKSIPLMTKVALFPGKPVVIFEDEKEKISLNLTISDSEVESASAAECINNLRQIDGAKEQWALENKAQHGDKIKARDVATYIKGGMPHCPDGGVYTIGAVGEAPRCSIPTHSLNTTSADR